MRLLCWACTAVLLAGLAGCGGASDQVAVTGTVTLDGNVLPDAVVKHVNGREGDSVVFGAALSTREWEDRLLEGGYVVQRAARPAVALTEVSALEGELRSEGPTEAIELLGSGALLRRCLEQIAAPQRNCLVLAYQDGLTHSEIAEKTGEALGTVKSWIRGGLLRLRESLQEASS